MDDRSNFTRADLARALAAGVVGHPAEAATPATPATPPTIRTAPGTYRAKRAGDLTDAERAAWEADGRPTLMHDGSSDKPIVRSRDGITAYANTDGTLRRVVNAGAAVRRPGESARAFKKRQKAARRG